MKILGIEDMLGVEAAAIRGGTDADELMERAGEAMAAAMAREYGARSSAWVAVGKGNNGGDGLVVARHLARAGWETRVHLSAGEADLGELPRRKLEALRAANLGVVIELPDQFPRFPGAGGVLVDGLLGIGSKGPLRGGLAACVRSMNEARERRHLRTVALDFPSGLRAFAEAPKPPGADVVVADLTLTVGFAKTDLVEEAWAGWVGRLEVIPLFDPALAPAEANELLTPVDLGGLLPRRGALSHKGTYGRALIVGGSPGFLGAPAMAARAALRMGAGLVNVALPGNLVDAGAALCPPEAMVVPRAPWGRFAHLLGQAHGVGIGPGLGTSREAAAMVKWVAHASSGPLVVDADALNLVAAAPGLLGGARAPLVLTPHPGEAKRLMGKDFSLSERPSVARELAERFHAVVVLKGVRTIVAAPGRPLAINGTGNPGLAKGGSGDTLTGIIVALLAQHLTPWDAARLGVWLHGRAADLAVRNLGSEEALLPSDVADSLGLALADLRGRQVQGLPAAQR